MADVPVTVHFFTWILVAKVSTQAWWHSGTVLPFLSFTNMLYHRWPLYHPEFFRAATTDCNDTAEGM